MAGMLSDGVRRSLNDLRQNAEHGEAYYISPPYGTPAKKLPAFYIAAFVLMLAAVGFLRPFAAFVGIFPAYIFYLNCKIWKRCGYNVALIAALSAVVLAILYAVSALVHMAARLLLIRLGVII